MALLGTNATSVLTRISPNSDKSLRGRSRAPAVADKARRKPSKEQRDRKGEMRLLRTVGAPRTPKIFFLSLPHLARVENK